MCCSQVVKLKAFNKFENTTEALAAASALLDGKLSKGEAAPVQPHAPSPSLHRLEPNPA